MINDDVITALFQNLKVRDPSLERERESVWDDYLWTRYIYVIPTIKAHLFRYVDHSRKQKLNYFFLKKKHEMDF
jgi:hypothetical protein